MLNKDNNGDHVQPTRSRKKELSPGPDFLSHCSTTSEGEFWISTPFKLAVSSIMYLVSCYLRPTAMISETKATCNEKRSMISTADEHRTDRTTTTAHIKVDDSYVTNTLQREFLAKTIRTQDGQNDHHSPHKSSLQLGYTAHIKVHDS